MKGLAAILVQQKAPLAIEEVEAPLNPAYAGGAPTGTADPRPAGLDRVAPEPSARTAASGARRLPGREP